MKQYLSLTPERERGHGRAVEWFPPSSPPAITTTASPRFSKKQLFAVVTVLSAAVVLVAVLSYGIKNDGKLGRIGSFQAASIDEQNVVNIFPNDIEADVNLKLLDLDSYNMTMCMGKGKGKGSSKGSSAMMDMMDTPTECQCMECCLGLFRTEAPSAAPSTSNSPTISSSPTTGKGGSKGKGSSRSSRGGKGKGGSLELLDFEACAPCLGKGECAALESYCDGLSEVPSAAPSTSPPPTTGKGKGGKGKGEGKGKGKGSSSSIPFPLLNAFCSTDAPSMEPSGVPSDVPSTSPSQSPSVMSSGECNMNTVGEMMGGCTPPMSYCCGACGQCVLSIQSSDCPAEPDGC